MKNHSEQETGFALLEVIVAMVIMALVGLMAWRGMDALIRGRETIERHANDDAAYTQLVRQFDRDCQEILRRDELNVTLANPTPTVATATVPSIAAGSKTIWWMRHYRADNQDSWLLVGYGMGPTGLQRLTSRPLLRRTDALALWNGIARDPDLISSDLLVSYEVPAIVRQTFIVQSANPVGMVSVPAGSSSTATPLASTSPVATPDQQGIQMQWWLKNASYPIMRSCLLGGSL